MTVPPHRRPLLIASAPNGARKTRQDHGALPVTAAQLADTAAEVMQAGAQMLHLHVRDADGRHTLDAGAYAAAVSAIRAQVGDDFFIQLTSEAAGVYDAEAQRRAIREICADDDLTARVDGMSVALRELIRAPEDRAPAGELFHHLARRGMAPQYILYSNEDIAAYRNLLEQGVIPASGHSVLLVVGRDDEGRRTPAVLREMVEALRPETGQPSAWMVCAFGRYEFQCLEEAVILGGHARVGFENSLLLRNRQPATDNRQLVTQLLESGNPDRRPTADIHQARKILGATKQPGLPVDWL